MTTAVMSNISLTEQQIQAVESIVHWYKKQNKKTYFLAGYAGTGKTTLVNYVIEELGIKLKHVEFACYTGKAALVLTQKAKGKFQAKTIHRLIYDINPDRKGPKFIRKSRGSLSHIKLIVIDEASMVDGQIMKDLKYFNKKILFVGDQGQLPPVSQQDNEEFVEMFNNPDFSLTEIHRQAQDNPIIYLSMLARTKQPIPYGKYGANGEVIVINKRQWESVKQACYTTADQIICGYNHTRHKLNRDIRNYLGFTSNLPQENDKLICIKNNWDKSIEDINLVNGMTGFVKSVNYDVEKTSEITRDCTEIQFRPDFTDDYFDNLLLVNNHFNGVPYKLKSSEYGLYSYFDYGYAITCHKSQGSQWENLVVLSEILNKEDHHKWLYTAITRSSERMILVI